MGDWAFNYMVRIINFLFLFFTSCAVRYNTAIIEIYNNSSVSLKYKGLLIDEQSGSNAGEMIIKVLSPNKEKIVPNSRDSIDITWANFQPEVFVNICWGVSNVYDASSGYFFVKDRDIIKISLDSTTDWHFIEE